MLMVFNAHGTTAAVGETVESEVGAANQLLLIASSRDPHRVSTVLLMTMVMPRCIAGTP